MDLSPRQIFTRSQTPPGNTTGPRRPVRLRRAHSDPPDLDLLINHQSRVGLPQAFLEAALKFGFPRTFIPQAVSHLADLAKVTVFSLHLGEPNEMSWIEFEGLTLGSTQRIELGQLGVFRTDHIFEVYDCYQATIQAAIGNNLHLQHCTESFKTLMKDNSPASKDIPNSFFTSFFFA